jgi:hypothetical protein
MRERSKGPFRVAFLGHHVQHLRQSIVHAVQEVVPLGVWAKAATTLVDLQPEQVARERRGLRVGLRRERRVFVCLERGEKDMDTCLGLKRSWCVHYIKKRESNDDLMAGLSGSVFKTFPNGTQTLSILVSLIAPPPGLQTTSGF